MSEVVSLLVSHSELKTFSPELRFVLNKTIAEVKEQLSRKCGTDPSHMKLQLKDDAQTTVFENLDDSKPLGYYSPYEGYCLHVVDLNPASNAWMEDLSQVEKFTMSDEQYDKLENSFRAFKKRMAASRNENAATNEEEGEVEVRCDINVGDRCQVDPGEKRGVVKFVGSVSQLKSGIWIGIAYDEPLGKNDGSINGERYFTCDPQHGAFVRPTRVRVGDFPPFDERFDDEI